MASAASVASMIYWTIVLCCSVLLQRGADFNVEDKEGVRADELARQCCAEDCGDAIVRSRQQHMSQLCKLVKQVLVSSVITRWIIERVSESMIQSVYHWSVSESNIESVRESVNKSVTQPSNQLINQSIIWLFTLICFYFSCTTYNMIRYKSLTWTWKLSIQLNLPEHVARN